MAAGEAHMRPIPMTTVAMIAGMMLNRRRRRGRLENVRSPMAMAVIGGLITSTFLTLLLVPVVFTLMDDVRHLFDRLATGDRRCSGGHPVKRRLIVGLVHWPGLAWGPAWSQWPAPVESPQAGYTPTAADPQPATPGWRSLLYPPLRPTFPAIRSAWLKRSTWPGGINRR